MNFMSPLSPDTTLAFADYAADAADAAAATIDTLASLRRCCLPLRAIIIRTALIIDAAAAATYCRQHHFMPAPFS